MPYYLDDRLTAEIIPKRAGKAREGQGRKGKKREKEGPSVQIRPQPGPPSLKRRPQISKRQLRAEKAERTQAPQQAKTH